MIIKKYLFVILPLFLFGCQDESSSTSKPIPYSAPKQKIAKATILKINQKKPLTAAKIFRIANKIRKRFDLVNTIFEVGEMIFPEEKKQESHLTKKELVEQFNLMIDKMTTLIDIALENQDKRKITADLRAAINYISAEKYDKAFDKLNEAWTLTENFLGSNSKLSKEWDLLALQIAFVWKKLASKLKNREETKKWNTVLKSVISRATQMQERWEKLIKIPNALLLYNWENEKCYWNIISDFSSTQIDVDSCDIGQMFRMLKKGELFNILNESILFRRKIYQIIRYLKSVDEKNITFPKKAHVCERNEKQVHRVAFNNDHECLISAEDHRKNNNFKLARRYYNSACELGVGFGCAQLSYSFWTGKDLNKRKNESLALKFAQKACHLNSAWGCRLKAIITENLTVEGKQETIFKLYKKSCDLNDSVSCNIFTNLLWSRLKSAQVEHDNDTNSSTEQILKNKILYYAQKNCLSSDANQHNATACKNLAIYYMLFNQKTKIIQFFEKSCFLKNSDSCRYLAFAYENGLYGVFKNLIKANFYLEKAKKYSIMECKKNILTKDNFYYCITDLLLNVNNVKELPTPQLNFLDTSLNNLFTLCDKKNENCQYLAFLYLYSTTLKNVIEKKYKIQKNYILQKNNLACQAKKSFACFLQTEYAFFDKNRIFTLEEFNFLKTSCNEQHSYACWLAVKIGQRIKLDEKSLSKLKKRAIFLLKGECSFHSAHACYLLRSFYNHPQSLKKYIYYSKKSCYFGKLESCEELR